MAIAHDATSSDNNSTEGWSSTTITWSHTCTGSDRILFVYVRAHTSDVVTGITYDSSAMTQIAKVQRTSDRWNYLYYIVAPSTGANNIVVTASEAIAYICDASSYTGANQTGVPDASTTQNATGTSVTTTLTTIANNSWIILTAHGFELVAGTNSYLRIADSSGIALFDTNKDITPAGSTGMTVTMDNSLLVTTIMASFAPVSASTFVPTVMMF